MEGPYTRTTGKPSTVVTTTAALTALSHPLRMQLTSLLRRQGPATASQLARQLDESSGSTSYHLRQLARYGLVELDVEQPNRRDRRWRAVTDTTDVDVSLLGHDPAAMAAVDRLVQMQIHRFARHAAAVTRMPGDQLAVWGPAFASSDSRLRLTPDMLGNLRDELLQVIARWDERGRALPDDEPDARPVSLYAGAVPLTGDDDGDGDW